MSGSEYMNIILFMAIPTDTATTPRRARGWIQGGGGRVLFVVVVNSYTDSPPPVPVSAPAQPAAVSIFLI